MARWMHDVAAPARRRRLLLVLTGVVSVALAATVVLMRPGTVDESPAATASTPTSSAAPSSPSAPRTAAPSTTRVTPSTSPDPAHEAELLDVAAGLPALSLASPARWDQWLPEGKPYPGVDPADDLSTCPVLSSRQETVVGQRGSPG